MTTETGLTTKSLFNSEAVQKKFREMLGKKATGFITSVLQVCASNSMLSEAEPMSIYNAAAMAATLDLPINNNLGFAYILPYRGKDGKSVAQFQLGYRAYIQLAQRSGQFKTISACPIYEGQLIEQNPLTGFKFDFTKKVSDTIIGYAAYFELLNGFEKTLYMTTGELKSHATKFSQTFKKGYGLWKDDFDSMAIKTVIKLLLSKFAPLSIEMQRAVVTDQSIINNIDDVDNADITYVDNEPIRLEQPSATEKEDERIRDIISESKSKKSLDNALKGLPLTETQQEAYTNKIINESW